VSSLFLAASPVLFAGNLNLELGSCAVNASLANLNGPCLLVPGFFVKKGLSWYLSSLCKKWAQQTMRAIRF
jgi:hypothetical protein